jgi:hypothetical protein
MSFLILPFSLCLHQNFTSKPFRKGREEKRPQNKELLQQNTLNIQILFMENGFNNFLAYTLSNIKTIS